MDWNPNEPTLEGLEWMGVEQGQTLLDADGKGVSWRFRSSAAETIDRFNLWIAQVAQAGYYLMEVYAEDGYVAGAEATDTFRPNEDTGVTNFENQAAAVVNLYQSIDESTLDTTDYIRNTNSSQDAQYTFKLDTAAWPANRRITDVRVVIVGRQVQEQQEWNLELRKQDAGYLTLWKQNIASVTPQFTKTVSLGPYNPFTGLPWLESEIETFDSTIAADRLSLVLRFKNFVGGAPQGRIYQVYMEIDYVTENRLAYARSFVQQSGSTSFLNLKAPDGTDNWSKANATTYEVVVHRIPPDSAPGDTEGAPLEPSVGAVAFGWLRDGRTNPTTSERLHAPPPQLDGGEGSIDEHGVYTLGAAGRLPQVYGFVLRTTAPATSVDGMPFDTVGTADCDPLTQLRQEVTPSGNTTVERVRFLVADDAAPSNDLTVSVRNDGTGALVGGAATVTPADLLDAELVAGGWLMVEATLSAPAALVAATQYRIQWDADPAETASWPVAYLESVFNYDEATYDGATDRGDIGSGYDGAIDFPAQLVNPPDTLTNFALVVGTQVLDANPDGCEVGGLQYAQLDWDDSVDADFVRYELERSVDGGVTWYPVYYGVTDETLSDFDDYEGARNVERCYRVRQVVLDAEVASNWSAEECATIATEGCEWTFTSNHDPTLNVAYIDVHEGDFADTTFSQPDASRAVLVPIYGRDYRVAFQPVETLGDEFTLPLLVSNGPLDPAVPGRRTFDAIVAIARADLPYVSVADSYGNEWLALVRVPTLRQREPVAVYIAEAQVAEVVGAPTPVTVEP